MSHGIKEYSQWFPGLDNNVADALSRDWDRTDAELTNILFSHLPSQMPKNFNIVPLPNEIISWVTSLLQRLPVKEQYNEKHTTTDLGRGNVGLNSASQSDSDKIFSSADSQNLEKFNSLEPSPWLCATGDLRKSLMLPWLKAQSKIPSHT
jgi:hypothetical protein